MKVAFFMAIVPLLASNSAGEIVTLSVASINELTISGVSPKLIISSATGGQLDPATDASTTYGVLTNDGKEKKVTAAIDRSMPKYTELKMALVAPRGGKSAGFMPLSETPKDFVGAIPSYSTQDKMTIAYQFSATTEAEVGSFSRVVTFTLTNQ